MSEREYLMTQLWGRVLEAFGAEETEEAEGLVRFHDRLAEMTDAEYDAIYDFEMVTV